MPTRICPICHKRFTYESIKAHAIYPFCSERCRDAELGAWLDGRYVVSRPVDEAEAEALPEEDHRPPLDTAERANEPSR